jgi:hypothetical protein
MQSKLREIEVNIEQERIKNENLKNVQVSEADLRKEINGIDRRVTRLESIGKVKENLHLFQDRDGD